MESTGSGLVEAGFQRGMMDAQHVLSVGESGVTEMMRYHPGGMPDIVPLNADERCMWLTAYVTGVKHVLSAHSNTPDSCDTDGNAAITSDSDAPAVKNARLCAYMAAVNLATGETGVILRDMIASGTFSRHTITMAFAAGLKKSLGVMPGER